MANPNQPNLGQTQQELRDIAAMTEDTFRSVADNIQSMFRDALEQGQNVSRSLGNDISNNLKSLARQSADSLNNQEKLNRGVLKQSDIQKQIEARMSKITSIENQINAARLAGVDISQDILEDLEDTTRLNNVYIDQLKEQKTLLDDIDKSLKNQLGFTPKLLSGLDKSLSKLGLPDLGFGKALDDTRKLAIQAKINGDEFNTVKTYTKQVGSNLSESLSKANLMQLGVGLLVEAFFKLDSMIGDTAKSMGISYQTAAQLNSEFVNIANNSGNIFVTTKGINESFNQINAALGTNGEISADILVTQTELVKQAGYSVEAATMLSKLSLATGKPTKDIAANFLGQVKALNLVNGTAINEKQLLEDISKVSKDTLATFADQPGKLAEAAYEARKLGLDLEKLKGTQSALLDIESSIASEFEAEVLTGKQLNLEKARYFALTNDYASLARELQKQDITRDSFSKMNVIQQEATAKALGMSAETMGGMLMDQEAMNKLSGIDGDNAKQKFDNLVKQVGMEEAKKQLGNDVLADQMASASIQDRFAATMEKLKEVFVSLVDPLMPVLDAFGSILNVVGMIMQPIGWIISGLTSMAPILAGIGTAIGVVLGLMNAMWVKTQAIAIMEVIKGAWSSLGGLPVVGPALAIAAIAGGIGYVKSQKAGDINSPADGKTQISTKEGGLFELSKNDDVVAFPGASKALSNPNIIKSPQQTIVQQSPSIDYDKMAQAMSRVQVQTNLDGVNVSRKLQTPMGIATRKL
jgi:hypothetical protein